MNFSVSRSPFLCVCVGVYVYSSPIIRGDTNELTTRAIHTNYTQYLVDYCVYSKKKQHSTQSKAK